MKKTGKIAGSYERSFHERQKTFYDSLPTHFGSLSTW